MNNLTAVRVADRVGNLPEHDESVIHRQLRTMNLHELVETQ